MLLPSPQPGQSGARQPRDREAAGMGTARLEDRLLELKGRQEPMDVVVLAGHDG